MIHSKQSTHTIAATVIVVSLTSLFAGGCRRSHRNDLDYDYHIVQTITIDELSEQPLLQFESVFWEPDDSLALRKLISEDGIAEGRKVLEIGTGTGLISLVCAGNGADAVVATDINPAAVANARYNAAMLELDSRLDVRQVDAQSPDAFSVIRPDERFDLILSNPPWEDGQIEKPADHAFYDPQFALMDSLLAGLPTHLNPGGRCLLAYGHVPAISRLLKEAERMGYQTKVLDDRKLDELATNFLPGMLVEIRLGKNQIPSDPVSAESDQP
ncbi:methyltransferase domain-containing protein [Stieleria sp. TO1_6]|uniref:methyltransferase n=1 Tax=Stieleria tagensis TaxID=2956795 RepID=UPI00209B3173|nr:methyltransferase [Stieleria tagensis]MCO8124963.1 methyltransferase domain-containing protein [Stieleria tagensis]